MKKTKDETKQNPPLTREQLLAEVERFGAAEEARARERRRPMTKRDLQRLGELTTKRRLNATDKQELATLQARFDVDRVRRDQGGEVVRTHIGDFFPAGEKRAARILKAERWKGARAKSKAEREKAERERLAGLLTAVEERRNIFARMGDLWLVSFEGRRAFVPDCAGMPYLFEILKRAASATGNDGGLTPADLCRESHLPPPERLPDGERLADEHEDEEPTGTTEADRNAIDAQDEEMRRRYMADPEARKRVAELKQELRTATGERKRTIQKTLALLGEGDPRRKRRAPDPAKEKARVRVANAIRRAIDDITKHHPAAGNHLRLKVRTENGRYTYDGPKFTT
jgi:hypothetical protein